MDQILSINGMNIANKALIQVETMLLGDPKSRVDIKVRRLTASKPLLFALQRESFAIQPISKTTMLYKEIGYIKLSNFQHKNTDILFQNTLKSLMQNDMKTLILDLRSNGGGSKHSLAIGSMFIESGILATYKKKNTPEQPLFARGDAFAKNLNILILINQGTASASELLASALRKHKKAILIGTPSFGKTSVQQIFPLQNGGALVCSIATYKTAENQIIDNKGLTPDFQKKVLNPYLRKKITLTSNIPMKRIVN